MLRKFFARTKPTSAEDVYLLDGKRTVNAVGESFYQKELSRISGGKSQEGHQLPVIATLVPEPRNQHDTNAVGVIVNGLKVGHLDRKKAAALQKPIMAAAATAGKPVGCRALIVGGWDRGRGDQGHFGIKLFFNDKQLLPQPTREKSAAKRKTPPSPPRGDANRAGRLWDVGALPDGVVHGRHYTEWVETVKQLKREDRLDDAIQLLRQCADAAEDEAVASDSAVAYGYFEQLAICFRKQKDFDAEIAILERILGHPYARGNIPPKLYERLDRARALRDR